MSESVAGDSASTRVPFGDKVAFGIGMLANQMFPAVLGIFMVVLVQNLGFPGWMWGILFFLPRVFDSLTDPIMGFISDNTRSKWGRRRQYVLVGAVVMGISFIAMWQLHKEDGVTYNFIYFLSWSFVFYLGLTIFSVPFVAMGYEMSNDFHERTSIMAVAQWIGQWAWVIAPWFWVIMYNNTPTAEQLAAVAAWLGDDVAKLVAGVGWFETPEAATRDLAIWVGVICSIFAAVPAIFLKQESTEDRDDYLPLSLKNTGSALGNIFTSFKEAFQSVPFRRLCVATFFVFNAFNTVAAFTFFIIVGYLFDGDAKAAGLWPTLFGSLGALVTTFLVIPAVAWLSKKMGKKPAFMLSQGISVFGYILFWFLFVPGEPWMFIIALPFFSFGIGSLFTLMMSMTADVIDLDELNNGVRREGIFGAIYWWMVKFGFAIAGLASGAIISYVGFDPNPANTAAGLTAMGLDPATVMADPADAMTGLRLFFSGLPILGTLIALWIMAGYDITEERANEIRAEIEAKRGRDEVISELEQGEAQNDDAASTGVA